MKKKTNATETKKIKAIDDALDIRAHVRRCEARLARLEDERDTLDSFDMLAMTLRDNVAVLAIEGVRYCAAKGTATLLPNFSIGWKKERR